MCIHGNGYNNDLCSPTLLYFDVELSIFPDVLLGDSAAIVDVDQLQAIADAKDGQTQLKDGRVIARGVGITDTVWTTRDYDSTGGVRKQVDANISITKLKISTIFNHR